MSTLVNGFVFLQLAYINIVSQAIASPIILSQINNSNNNKY